MTEMTSSWAALGTHVVLNVVPFQYSAVETCAV